MSRLHSNRDPALLAIVHELRDLRLSCPYCLEERSPHRHKWYSVVSTECSHRILVSPMCHIVPLLYGALQMGWDW